MVAYIIYIVIGILSGAGCCAGVVSYLRTNKDSFGGTVGSLEEVLQKRIALKEELEAVFGQMADIALLQKAGRELITVRESLKTERGRITITQAELETVESRLRELEEIERELEASKIDTQEEIKILEKKKGDLGVKNSRLKEQLEFAVSQLDTAVQELELSTQMQEQMQAIKLETVQTQERIDAILMKIDESNQQYFVLKKRYDALDIEYAQLYEKFQMAEEALKEKV